MRSGLFLTAVNFHLSLEEQLYILRDCGAKVLIVSAEQADAARAILKEVPDLGLKLVFGGQIEGYDDFEAALAGASDVRSEESRVGKACVSTCTSRWSA